MDSAVDWIALSLLPGPGPIGMRRLVERYRDPGLIAHRLPVDELVRNSTARETNAEQIRRARRTLAREAEREWRRCRKLGIRVLTPRSPGYPLALETLPDAPVVL
ncbi:MAG: DNA-protecting protein DprA, partial [bacterium]|nr:DNA-protecting protein DprA [bacterium]